MGQAKRNKAQAVKSTGKQSIDKYMAWIVDAYLVYMMTIFILVCPQGYVQYDFYKRNMLYIGTVPFVVISLVFILASIANEDDVLGRLKGSFGKTDLFMLGTLVVWIISYLGCADKQSGFWGDVYRYIGFSSMALTLIACWIISKYFKFEKWLLWLFMAVSCVVFGWQILNMYGIDPLNWQMDRQYVHLVSVFANINQNAVFDAMAFTVVVIAFVNADKRIEQIVYGVVVFVAMLGGIASRSESYYFGVFVALLVLIGYALAHTEYLVKTWCVGMLFVFAVILQRYGYNRWIVVDDNLLFAWPGDGVIGVLFQEKVLVCLSLCILLLGVIILFLRNLLQKLSKKMIQVYIGLLVIGVLGIAAVFVYANKAEIDPASGSILLQMKFNDNFGSYRGAIWRVSFYAFGGENIFQKLFGIGMNNYSTFIYQNGECARTINEIYQNAVLADAHNIYLDMLISSGILGVISLFGIIVELICKSIKQFKEKKMAVCAVMCVVAYMAAGLLNSNLIVTTPVFFILLGCFWKNCREEACEIRK